LPTLTLPALAARPCRVGSRERRIFRYGAPPASAELRGARLSKGLTVDQAAARFRIPGEHIQAMERADLGSLAENVYVDGFIRSYARLTGAQGMFGHNPDWYVRALRREYEEGPHFPGKARIRRRPSATGRGWAWALRAGILSGGVAVLALTGFGCWHVYQAVQDVKIVESPLRAGVAAADWRAVDPPAVRFDG